jgi:hypothetical protein
MSVDKTAALSISIFGALLYFTGWAYLYHYFKFFLVDIFEIKPSIQFVLIHSFSPLYHFAQKMSWGLAILIIALAIITVLVISILKGLESVRKRVTSVKENLTSLAAKPGVFTGAILLALVTLFFASFWISRSAALERATSIWDDSSNVVYFNLGRAGDTLDIRAKISDRTERLNRDLELRYLMSTEKFHYAFARDPDCAQNQRCGGFIIKLPVEAVKELIITK